MNIGTVDGPPTLRAGEYNALMGSAIRIIVGPPLRIVGSASGELVYDQSILGRVTCSSATWVLERREQS